MNNKKIGIIGFGVVGRAAYFTLSKQYEIVKYDKYQKLDNFIDLNGCKFVFIMVPTPFDCSRNEVDKSAVLDSLDNLDKINFGGIVILKSTVPPGFCDTILEKYNFDIVFNPEFLRESTTPNEDFEKQDTVVIGTLSEKIFKDVKKMYQKVLRTDASYYQTTNTEAEMIKCAQNTMLSSRVAIANIIYDACEEYSIDYQKIREIAFDSFDILGPHMVQVPGPDGNRGFGGKCLPKDIRAFCTSYESDVLRKIIDYNDTLRDDLDKVLLNFKK